MNENAKNAITSLKNLLIIAIGDNRTQKQFAEESGISQTHISRMLNEKTLVVPSIQTIKKIADNSEGRVTINQIKDIFGMQHTEEDDKLEYMKSLPPSKRNMKIAGELCEGFCDISERPVKYKSLDDVCDMIKMLYGYGNMKYEIEDEIIENAPEFLAKKYEQNEKENPAVHNNAEEVANIYFEWSDEETTAEWGCTVFYCKTQKGGIWLNDVAFDYETTHYYRNLIAAEIAGSLGTEDTEDISLTFLQKIKDTHVKIARNTGKDVETLLAHAIVDYAYAVESVLYDKDMNGENEDGKLYEKATDAGEHLSFIHSALMNKIEEIRKDPYTSDREMASLGYAVSKILPEMLKEPLEDEIIFDLF